MKQQVKALLAAALRQLADAGTIPHDALPDPQLERTRDPSHGDFSSNAAMVHGRNRAFTIHAKYLTESARVGTVICVEILRVCT